MEDGVFPMVLRGMPVPRIHEQIMEIEVETPAVLEQTIQEIPKVQIVERPPRPKMAAQLVALPKTVLSGGIQQQNGVQTVDAPASQVVEELVEAHTGEEVPLELNKFSCWKLFVGSSSGVTGTCGFSRALRSHSKTRATSSTTAKTPAPASTPATPTPAPAPAPLLGGVMLALQAHFGIHSGVDNLNVLRSSAKLNDRGIQGTFLPLVKDCDLLLTIHSMLSLRRQRGASHRPRRLRSKSCGTNTK